MRKYQLFAVFLLLCVGTFAGAAENFAGTYTTSISEADVPPELKAAVGLWEIFLGDQNEFTASRNGEVAARGSYSLAGDHMTFSDEDGPMACAKDQTGTYLAALDKDVLTFTKSSDACNARSIILTSHSLTRKKNP